MSFIIEVFYVNFFSYSFGLYLFYLDPTGSTKFGWIRIQLQDGDERGSGSDSGAEIRVDLAPDLTKCSGSISGSETLASMQCR